MAFSAEDHEKLAGEFAAVLEVWLTEEEFAEMKATNATPDYAGDSCASHNYCDANIAMAEAFQNAFNREPDIQSDIDLECWNAAWKIAKPKYLTAAA